jgi:hypothetical protein
MFRQKEVFEGEKNESIEFSNPDMHCGKNPN